MSFSSIRLGALCATFIVLSSSALPPAQAQTGGVFSGGVPSLPAPLPPEVSVKGPRAKFEPGGNKVYHGASLPDTWDSGLRARIDQYRKAAGKNISVVTWFASAYENGRMTSWRNNYLSPLQRVKHAGAVSLIKFSVQDAAYTRTRKIAGLKQITQGAWDAYFEEAADTVRLFDSPVFISINHEMNGNWYPYSEAYAGSGVTAKDYIAAWRRIVEIFRRKEAANAAFVWSPNVPDVGGVPFTSYYPGDEYVDWVGASFYSGNAVENLDLIYRTYAARKPIFITEWATAPEKNRYYSAFPGEAKWIAAFFGALEKRYPRVKAISWFQWNKEDGNYLLERVPEQQQTYRDDIKNPRYVDSPDELVQASDGEVTFISNPPREVILREAVPVEKAATEAAPQAAPREKVRSER